MKKIVIFGTGDNGKAVYASYRGKEDIQVVAFADNFNTGELFGCPIVRPDELITLEFDAVLIASISIVEIEQQLLSMGIPSYKIEKTFTEFRVKARETFLKNFASEIYHNGIKGNVAEAGAFRGEFAALINKYFFDRKIYIFDTFEGFHPKDIMIEQQLDAEEGRESVLYGFYAGTSEEIVRKRLPYPENSVIVRGHVPESLYPIADMFCFVNLDIDLYLPTLKALEWFYPRIVHGGVILIHDYFDNTYMHLKKGVRKFIEENDIRSVPIGDDLSIVLLK